MKKINQIRILSGLLLLFMTACKAPDYIREENVSNIPTSFLDSSSIDTNSIGAQGWKSFYKDPFLIKLIDSALKNNQEINIQLMEMAAVNSEVLAKKGEYLPSLGLKIGGGADKVGRYTTHGAMEASTEMLPGKEIPELVPDLNIGVYAKWEVDIWKKLRNSKTSALKRYFASTEGMNFTKTQIVAEIANSYYELLALDKQIDIINQNIEIQSNVLNIVKIQKEAAKATELAVKKFEAEVYRTKSMKYAVLQSIVEHENRINFLLGRYPQKVERDISYFDRIIPEDIQSGIPSNLIDNRPDIRQASFQLEAAKLDVKVAKASFYPTLSLDAGIGLDAFNPTYIIKPQSILLNLAGNMVAPLLNRNALKAQYQSANAKQMQAVYNYERSVLSAVLEVVNQVNNIDNLKKSYELKEKQVDTLLEALNISGSLFASARADYMEILMTQRDVVESRFDLIETKLKQFQARINVYKALGGGWK